MPQNNYSHVKSFKDLQAEINASKNRVAVHEQQLKQRIKTAPAQIAQTALGKVLPFFLTTGVAVKSFGIIKNVFGLVSSIRNARNGTFKQGLINTVKKVGALTAVKAAFNIFKNRKLKKQQTIKL